MASALDLEEQEQLAQIKAFWNVYGNLITWTLLLIAGAFVAWNGWHYWQRSKAAQASVLFEEVERSAQAGELDRTQRAFDDMKAKFEGTSYAQQAGLAAAKAQYDKGQVDAARASLMWVAEHAVDSGYKAVARLRLAAVLLDAKSYPEVDKQLGAEFPREFQPLVADMRGDMFKLQGEREKAAAEYRKAWKELGAGSEYRRLVEFKLNAVGVDPASLAAAPAVAAASAPVEK